jgi:hypothetical protein
LVEMLLAVGLFVVVGVVVLSVFFVSLRGSKKSDLLVVVRQDGESVLSQMEHMIRFAKSLDSPSSCVPSSVGLSSITVSSFDGGQTVLTCPSGSGAISSNSASLVDTTSVVVSSCSFSCTQSSLSNAPIIGISFVLSQATTSNFVEGNVSIPFHTSIQMRNYLSQ